MSETPYRAVDAAAESQMNGYFAKRRSNSKLRKVISP